VVLRLSHALRSSGTCHPICSYARQSVVFSNTIVHALASVATQAGIRIEPRVGYITAKYVLAAESIAFGVTVGGCSQKLQ